VRRDALYTTLALAVLALAVVPVGVAVFVLGFIDGDSPCVMCWEQRIGMALIALIGLFILRYGPKPKYIGMGVLVAIWGVFMGIRHTGMHAARDVGQGFSAEILGAHTYTWSLLIFWASVAVMGLLLTMTRKEDIEEQPRTLRPLEALAGIVFLVVIAANVVQAFASTGPPPFMGQSDPVRFSFSPSHWVWSTEEWSLSRVSLRGRWSIDKPEIAALSPDPARGPLVLVQSLPIIRQLEIGFPLNGTPTDLAYDPATAQFLITTQRGIYLADDTLKTIRRYTIVDTGYSVDLGQFAAAAFLDKGAVMAVGENKSFVVVRPSTRDHADANFRYFLESASAFDELSRSRFGTVRARMMYVLSAAYDQATNSIYTVSVPNNKVKRLVVSRFDRRDMTLSEEFTPTVAPDGGPAFAAKRTVDEFVVTGATVVDGSLYAISAAYSTLLRIDLATHRLVEAYAIPGLVSPTGLAAKGDELYIVGAGGKVWVVSTK
jgi:disulfide bond formation protein DsbB